jgi:hypothetical protein
MAQSPLLREQTLSPKLLGPKKETQRKKRRKPNNKPIVSWDGIDGYRPELTHLIAVFQITVNLPHKPYKIPVMVCYREGLVRSWY